MKKTVNFKGKLIGRQELKTITGGVKSTSHRSCNVSATYGPVSSPHACCSLGSGGWTVTPWGDVCGYI